MEMRDKVAVVTGAASGIGRGCAEAFAAEGAKVVLADIDLDGAETAAAAIREQGGAAVAIRCDVSQDGQFEAVRDLALDRFGGVDIVMNNAGVLISGHPEDIPLSEWERVFSINLFSAVRSNAVFLPILLAQGSGHIVNTSSFSGLLIYAFDRLPYAASKAALFQMSEGLALYLRPKGIGVTVLCPGPVTTNIRASTRVWTEGVVIRGSGAEFTPLTPQAVGAQVVDAVRRNVFFLPTHPEVVSRLIRRFQDVDAALEEQIALPFVRDPRDAERRENEQARH